MLCRIFEKSGLGPPNGDRYAPFIEEEWEDDAALLVPGGEAEEELANGDDVRIGASDFEKVCFSFSYMYSVLTLSWCCHYLLYTGTCIVVVCSEFYMVILLEYSLCLLHSSVSQLSVLFKMFVSVGIPWKLKELQ